MPPKGKGRAPAKRKLAAEFPVGEVLTDSAKKRWKIGPPIGKGGFGLLYLANEDSSEAVGTNAPYVIKVEPSDNGPLFSELKFYMRAAKPNLIESWIRSHKLRYLGVPNYWGSGLHEKAGNRYRFMVMDRFGTDLQKMFEEGGRKFPRKLVLQLGLRLIDILEYIHEHEYVHADIKASNLLLSYKNPNQVYLVDYGLAYRYSPEGVLKEYKEDPRRCHDGTIEFTSIDAHNGVSPSRRADLEILGYCMIQWLCGRLPWEDKLQDPVYVRDQKFKSRNNISEFISKCFSSENKPEEMVKFMEAVKSLGYQDKPAYQKLRSILEAGLKSIGATDDDKLDFSVSVNGAGPSSTKKATKRKIVEVCGVSDETDIIPAKTRPSPKRKVAKAVHKKAPVKKAPVKKVPVKKSPLKKSPLKKSPLKKSPANKDQVEIGTQTTPGLEVRSKARGRPKKNA